MIRLKKVSRSSASLIVTILPLLFLCAANAKAITLNEALQNALSNNSEIKLEHSRLNQVKATKGDAISEFLPDVYVTYQRGQQKNDSVDTDRGDLDKRSDQGVTRLNLNQPIFNGFSSYNNSKEIKYRIKSAEQYYKSKKFEILLSATESYLKLFQAQKLVSLKTQDEENTKKLLELIKDRNKSGEVGGSEVIKYQTFVTTAISDRLTAQKDLFKTRFEYEKNIGAIDEELSFPVINKNKISKNRQELLELAIASNPNLKSYFFKIKSATSSVHKSKGKFSPVVEISASISEEENVTYLDNSDLRSESIFLNVKIPLFQKGTEYVGMSKARKDLSFSKREYQTNKENIIQEIKQTHQEFIFFDGLIKSQEELIELTNSRIENIDQQVKVGSGDIIDLVESKLELNKILIQQLSNKTDYVLSYYKLLILTGNFEL
jgi:outer membrane protein TolC